jgi:hypothetical protein
MGLGGRFFQDKPKDFTGHLKDYWKAWRSRTGSKPPSEPQSPSA